MKENVDMKEKASWKQHGAFFLESLPDNSDFDFPLYYSSVDRISSGNRMGRLFVMTEGLAGFSHKGQSF